MGTVWCVNISNPMPVAMPSKGTPAKPCLEDPALLTGHFTRNEFLASVFEHLEDQDEPLGSNPLTWGDLYCPTLHNHERQPAANGRQVFHVGVRTLEGDGHRTWVPGLETPEFKQGVARLVVNVPKEAKSLTDHPKYQAKMDAIFKIYEDILSGKTCKKLPVRGAFERATIPLNQGYRRQRHLDLHMKGERQQAMVKILTELIERVWTEPCSMQWAPPRFVIPKKVTGEWRLIVDYRDLNL